MIKALLLGVWLAAAGPEVTVTGPQPAIPGQVVATGTFVYSVPLDGQSCSLRYWPAEAGMLLNTSARPATMDRFAACLAPLVDAVLRDHPEAAKLTVRLSDLSDLTQRIDAALDVSPDWDVRTGAPRSGPLSDGLRALVNTRHLAHELADVFAQRGYTLQATAARLISTGRRAGFGRHVLVTGIGLLEFTAQRTGERS